MKANKVNFIYPINVLLPIHYMKIAVRLWEYTCEQIRKKKKKLCGIYILVG